jgi:hypothetical protein
LHLEAQTAAHRQHDRVFGQHVAGNGLQSLDFAYSIIICIGARPSPLPLRSDRNRIAYSPHTAEFAGPAPRNFRSTRPITTAEFAFELGLAIIVEDGAADRAMPRTGSDQRD